MTLADALEREAKSIARQLRAVGINIKIVRPERKLLLWKVHVGLHDDALGWPVRLEHVRAVFLTELGRRFYMHFVITGEETTKFKAKRIRPRAKKYRGRKTL